MNYQKPKHMGRRDSAACDHPPKGFDALDKQDRDHMADAGRTSGHIIPALQNRATQIKSAKK